jgi:hypothetical protein
MDDDVPAVWPNGTYSPLEVIEVHGLMTQTGRGYWRLTLKLVGTSATFYKFIGRTSKADWVWQEMGLNSWEDGPSLIGTQWMANIRGVSRPAGVSYFVDFIAQVSR